MSRSTANTKGLTNERAPLRNDSRREPLVKNTEIRYAGLPASASRRPSRSPRIMAMSGWMMNRNRPGPLNSCANLSGNSSIIHLRCAGLYDLRPYCAKTTQPVGRP